jgi:hypothetical protein
VRTNHLTELDFKPDFQNYRFTNHGFLIITGTGRDERVGAYEVTILQV